jgi:hypothetical protein
MMKILVKTVMAGALILGSVVCTAQSITVNTGQPYTVPSAAAANCTGCSYRWLENGNVIPDANSAEYTNSTGKGFAGTYVYVRQASIDGCGWQNSNAFIVEVIGPYTMSSEKLTIRQGDSVLTWSDYVCDPSCVLLDPPNNNLAGAACAFDAKQSACYFSKEYVKRDAAKLCPAPWSVPTHADFSALDRWLGGTGLNDQNCPCNRSMAFNMCLQLTVTSILNNSGTYYAGNKYILAYIPDTDDYGTAVYSRDHQCLPQFVYEKPTPLKCVMKNY